MSSPWDQDRFIAAYKFAATAHNGMKYNGTDLPYLLHISLVSMEVMAALAAEDGHDGDLAVQCAALHDIIEDTWFTYTEIEAAFGKCVADGVQALSKDPMVGSSSQMEDSLHRITLQSPEIGMVKLADRITNLLPPPKEWDAEKIKNYRDEAILIHQKIKGASPYLAKRLEKKIEQYPG